MNAPSPSAPRRGFTLIELLTVIAIIVLLAGLSVIGINIAHQKTALSKTKIELKQLASALEAYKADHGEYPVSVVPECGGLVLYSALYGDGEPTNGKATGMDGTHDPNKEIYLKNLDPENGAMVVNFSLVDPWGNKYRYLRNPAQPDQQLNPDFDLWSIGPKGTKPIHVE